MRNVRGHDCTFNIGVKLREDPVIRYDFKKADWVEWEKSCTEAKVGKMPANKHICHASGIYGEIPGNNGK